MGEYQTIDISALGLQADAPQELSLWIVAAKPVFAHFGRTVSWRLEVPQRRQRVEGTAGFEQANSSHGAILQFLAQSLIPLLPRGSQLQVFTRETTVSEPYELGRLATWKVSGEINEKADWLRLEEVRERHGVKVTAHRPAKDSPDLAVLMAMTDAAKGIRPKRQSHPGDPVGDDGSFRSPPFDVDMARERAIAKDRRKE